ncbi:MAG TPA: hypothetical protein VFC78_06130 [Tepidisphaeraceae bacterium]|nr:hypothetical protein [Tepidisphaeraceae bacterium]
MISTDPTQPNRSADKARASDIALSAIVPLYGAIVGLIAISNGNGHRGRTMAALSTGNMLVIVTISHWLVT